MLLPVYPSSWSRRWIVKFLPPDKVQPNITPTTHLTTNRPIDQGRKEVRMERLRTPYIVPWHPWPGRCPKARTHPCVRADAAVLPQVTSKKTLQCVQVTDAPTAIVQSSVRPSVRPSENVRVTILIWAWGFQWCVQSSKLIFF
jgi:hypothetical protein